MHSLKDQFAGYEHEGADGERFYRATDRLELESAVFRVMHIDREHLGWGAIEQARASTEAPYSPGYEDAIVTWTSHPATREAALTRSARPFLARGGHPSRCDRFHAVLVVLVDPDVVGDVADTALAAILAHRDENDHVHEARDHPPRGNEPA